MNPKLKRTAFYNPAAFLYNCSPSPGYRQTKAKCAIKLKARRENPFDEIDLDDTGKDFMNESRMAPSYEMLCYQSVSHCLNMVSTRYEERRTIT